MQITLPTIAIPPDTPAATKLSYFEKRTDQAKTIPDKIDGGRA